MTDPRSGPATWVPPIVFGVFALVLYLPSLGGEFLNWDDQWLVVDNAQMAEPGFAGVALSTEGSRARLGYEYLPARDLSYWLDRKLFGLSARAFHRTNVMIYALSCALVFLLLREWTRSEAAAVGGTLFFVVHPIHVESVAWIAERKGLLALLFLVFALLVFFRWLREGRWRLFAGFLFLYALAGASKSTVHFLPIALPFLVPVAVQDEAGRRAAWRRCWLAVGGALMIAVPLVAMNAHFQSLANSGNTFPGGSLGSAIPIMATVVVRYGIQLVAPVGLAADYDVPPSLDGALAAAGIASLALIVALGVFLLHRWWRGRGRGVAAGLFAFAALGPVSNLVPISNQMADRYLLLPSIGVAVVVGMASAAAWRRWGRPVLAVGATIAVLFAVLSIRQMQYWETPLALWERATSIAPLKARSWVNLGEARVRAGDAEGAIVAYGHAVSADPDDAFVRMQVAQKLHRVGRFDDAMANARRAVELDDRSILAHDQLARFLAMSGSDDSAEIERLFRRGIQLADEAKGAVERAVLRRNLGEFLYRTARLDDARLMLEGALKYEPVATERASIHRTLALIATQMNDTKRKIENLQRAIALAPKVGVDARVILAESLLKLRRPEDRVEARRLLEESIRLLEDAVRVGRNRPADAKSVSAARRMLAQLRGR